MNQAHKVLLLSIIFFASAQAQDESFKFEITPFTSYRFGGSFDEMDGTGEFELNDSNAFGVMLDIKANPNGQWELLYAKQSTEIDTQGLFVNDPFIDLDIEYFHFGGTYLFDGKNVRPFIAMTVGLSQFDPQFADLDTENFFSASFGGGVQLNATGRLGARLEGRVFSTFVDSESSFFCSSAGGAGACLIQLDGTVLTQWEARAGLVFRF